MSNKPKFDFKFMRNSTQDPNENKPKQEKNPVYMNNTTVQPKTEEVKRNLSDAELEALAKDIGKVLDDFRKEQEEKRRKETEETVNAIKKNLEELQRRLPQKIYSVFANGMYLFQGARMMMPSFYGYVSYVVSACVSFEGKEYVIVRPDYTNMYTVYYVSGGMLFPEMNMNVSNAIVNYCTSQFWLV